MAAASGVPQTRALLQQDAEEHGSVPSFSKARLCTQVVLERRYVLAALVAAAATCVRQNNAVWAACSLGVGLWLFTFRHGALPGVRLCRITWGPQCICKCCSKAQAKCRTNCMCRGQTGAWTCTEMPLCLCAFTCMQHVLDKTHLLLMPQVGGVAAHMAARAVIPVLGSVQALSAQTPAFTNHLAR